VGVQFGRSLGIMPNNAWNSTCASESGTGAGCLIQPKKNTGVWVTDLLLNTDSKGTLFLLHDFSSSILSLFCINLKCSCDF